MKTFIPNVCREFQVFDTDPFDLWACGLGNRQVAQITILAEKAGKTHFLIQLALYFHA